MESLDLKGDGDAGWADDTPVHCDRPKIVTPRMFRLFAPSHESPKALPVSVLPLGS